LTASYTTMSGASANRSSTRSRSVAMWREVSVEVLARRPALDEGEARRVVDALVEGVEDAPVLAVGRHDQVVERLAGLLLLAGTCLERAHDHYLRHAILPGDVGAAGGAGTTGCYARGGKRG
jgi:hypothetical protein